MGGGLSIAQLMIDCAVSVRGGVEWCRIERWGVRRRRRYIRFVEWRSHSNAIVGKRWGEGGETFVNWEWGPFTPSLFMVKSAAKVELGEKSTCRCSNSTVVCFGHAESC